MNDLISRVALLDDMPKNDELLSLDVRRVICAAPAVDAVPVVRCNECVCSSMLNDTLICERIKNVMDGYYRGTTEVVKPDDYCSHGVRQRAKMDGGAE